MNLLGDHLGSTALTADGASGAKLSELRYKPWGEVRYVWGATMTGYRYTGQRMEGTGLYDYGGGTRWYDPMLGRWTSPDSIVPLASQGVQALDRYAYVNNNSMRYTDPSGHDLEQIMFDKNHDKYGPPKKIEKRESQGWSRWLLQYGGAQPAKLTMTQKIGKCITVVVVAVVLVPVDFALIALTMGAGSSGFPGVLAEVILVPIDFFVADFTLSFNLDIYNDITSGYENDFEWILTNSVTSLLPSSWQSHLHNFAPNVFQ